LGDRGNGRPRGQFFGIPATGKEITVKGMVIDRVVDGQMADSRILMDGLSMMRQLGVIPALD
jgi:predicted ester cyclase